MIRTSESRRSPGDIAQLITDRFRIPAGICNFVVDPKLSGQTGYFRFGSAICYGQCSTGAPASRAEDSLPDTLADVHVNGSAVHLPFDPAKIIDNLRCERYNGWDGINNYAAKSGFLRDVYYLVRPLMGVAVRKHFQKYYFRGWDQIRFPQWPVDVTVEAIFEQLLTISMKWQGIDRLPFIWFWPDGAPSCTILTHDVETAAGLNFCETLMDLNDSFGIKTSFQIVPEDRYYVSQERLEKIRSRGFEVNIHDLNHDGRLMSTHEEFQRRAQDINAYGHQFGASGFRSAVMYRNIDWHDELNFCYDMSIPNVAHLDPQRGGCCTVFPFFAGNILELPVTTVQDYSLFQVLNDYSIELWQKQIAAIRARNGMISTIVHPDYIIDETARSVYAELLNHLDTMRSLGETWIALPREVAAWWRLRSEMTLIGHGGEWRIEGEGRERARLAYAVLKGDSLTYEFN